MDKNQNSELYYICIDREIFDSLGNDPVFGNIQLIDESSRCFTQKFPRFSEKFPHEVVAFLQVFPRLLPQLGKKFNSPMLMEQKEC